MSFAADATVQLTPPLLELSPPPSLPCRTPELEITSGPLISAAAPVLLDTSDAILPSRSGKSRLSYKAGFRFTDK